MRPGAARLALLLLAALPAAARADEQPGGEPAASAASEVRRAGAFLGASLGAGSQHYSAGDAEELEVGSAGIGAHLGGMVSPRFGIAIELTYLSGESDQTGDGPDVVVWQRQFAAWVRYWPIPRLWLQGGLASVRAGSRSDEGEGPTRRGGALIAALGYEVVHRDSIALDVALRLGAGGFADRAEDPDDLSTTTVALLASLSWFP